jgi:hypothetical protein
MLSGQFFEKQRIWEKLQGAEYQNPESVGKTYSRRHK